MRTEIERYIELPLMGRSYDSVGTGFDCAVAIGYRFHCLYTYAYPVFLQHLSWFHAGYSGSGGTPCCLHTLLNFSIMAASRSMSRRQAIRSIEIRASASSSAINSIGISSPRRSFFRRLQASPSSPAAAPPHSRGVQAIILLILCRLALLSSLRDNGKVLTIFF